MFKKYNVKPAWITQRVNYLQIIIYKIIDLCWQNFGPGWSSIILFNKDVIFLVFAQTHLSCKTKFLATTLHFTTSCKMFYLYCLRNKILLYGVQVFAVKISSIILKKQNFYISQKYCIISINKFDIWDNLSQI